jgi:hypothetical protein
MGLKSICKGLCYVGILSIVVHLICDAVLTSDKTGWNFNFGLLFDIIVLIIFLFVFLSFLLPLFYIKSYSKKLFITTFIIVIIAMIAPGYMSWQAIEKWLQPKPAFDLSGIFGKTSDFRRNIIRFQGCIITAWFVLQLLILVLTFRIRNLKVDVSAKTPIDLHPNLKSV